ncbi:MAG: DNA polymerase III subunit gamma/tau [Balneolaceae bacterium]
MSDNYRALTRKYRPLTFEDIVSQEHVSSTIQNAIKQNRLSHAYMFCGPRGVGKTTMARVLARTINGIDAEVDGESLNQTLNIIEMDAASNNKVEDVHHLRESVRIPPQNGRYKIFIIDEVHMLSKQAFNALLKTLEEPPEHAIFIFATTEPHKVLPTILSRVQRFDFKRIPVDEIVQRLRKISLDENISIDEESLHVIAKKADGALRDAVGLMDQAIAFCGDTITYNELLQALNVVGIDRLFEFMDCVKANEADKGLELINTLLQEGYDIQEYLIGLTEHLRNLYIAHHSEKLFLVEASEDTKSRYKKSAPDFSRDDLMRMLHIVSEAQIKLKDASQPRIQFEITLLKLIHMERTEQLSKLLSELDDLKKKSSNYLNGSSSNRSASSNGHQKTDEDIKQTTPQSTPENTPKPISENPTNGTAKKQDVRDVEVMEPEPEDDFDIGKPALETSISKKIMAEKKVEKTSAEPALQDDTRKEEVPAKLTFESVQEVWPEYLRLIKETYPMLLHLQLERVKLVKLKGAELHLQCDNQFAKKMLDEQNTELARKLKECLGNMLRFQITVSNSSDKSGKKMNPYERFKQLQQKDPLIRDIVEIFGAELEY